MKKANSDLFDLIQSMTKGEKRYFSLFSSLQGKNESKKYLLLFNALEKQSTYNEKEIREVFKNDSFIGKRFDQAKFSLQKLVLKSLRVYHQRKSIDSKLNDDIQHIKILNEKELYDVSIKIIRKSKQTAADHEKRWHYIYLSLQEISWYFIKEKPEVEIRNQFEVFLREIEIYKNQQEYNQLKTLILIKGAKGIEGEFAKGLKEIIDHPLFSSQEKALSVSAGKDFLYAYSMYFFSIKDYASSYKNNLELIALMESNPQLIEENEFDYGTYLYRQLVLQKRLGLHDDAFDSIKKIRGIQFKSQKNHAVFNCMFNNTELPIYRDLGEFDKAISLMKTHEKMLNESVGYLKKQTIMLFHYGCAAIYVITENYVKANKHINFIMNNTSFENTRSDLQCGLRTLKLIIYYEQKNYDLMEHAAKSYYRYFKKGGHLTTNNKLMLDLFSKGIPKANSKEEFQSLWIQAKEELEEAIKKLFNKHYYDFDLVSWLGSKIKNKSFAEVIKEKAKTLQKKNLSH